MRLAATIVALLAATAARADLTTNGGFESGDFSGWTQFGDTSYTGVGSSPVAEGTYAAYFGPITSTGGISQTIYIPAGTPLTIDFMYQAQGSLNSFSADFGGVNLVSLTNDTSHTDWSFFSFSLTAPTDNPTLSFTFSNPPSYDYLDAVHVNVAPTPGSLALLGLGGLMASRRGRR